MKTIQNFSVIAILFVAMGCGIKGKPQPPLKPPELGRGKPTYKGATQKFLNEALQENDLEEDEEKEDE